MGLRHIFGEKPIPKLLDFLRVHKQWDYPLSTLAEATNISYRTLQAIVPELVNYGLLIETRTLGRAKMYQLNFSSEAIKKLDEFATLADIEFVLHSEKDVEKPARSSHAFSTTG